MIVSNPGGGKRKLAWQKRNNDLIRALRDERNDLLSYVKTLERTIANLQKPPHKDLTRRGQSG
jgi:hypothetical protein